MLFAHDHHRSRRIIGMPHMAGVYMAIEADVMSKGSSRMFYQVFICRWYSINFVAIIVSVLLDLFYNSRYRYGTEENLQSHGTTYV